MTDGYKKSEIVDAVVQALAPLSLDGGGNVRVVEAYRGESGGASLLQTAIQLPAVLVSYASSSYRPGPYFRTRETVGLNVFVLCRTGASLDCTDVLADVRDILAGSALGLDVSPLKLVRESQLVETKELSVHAALYSVEQTVTLAAQVTA